MAKKSMFAALSGDTDLETSGVYLDLEVVRIKLARAGGNNKAFLSEYNKVQQKHGKAINANLISNDRGVEINQELWARTLVKGWDYPNPDFVSAEETPDTPEWLPGVEQEDGTIADPSPEAYVRAWRALPNLWVQCFDFTNDMKMFNRAFIEEIAGN